MKLVYTYIFIFVVRLPMCVLHFRGTMVLVSNLKSNTTCSIFSPFCVFILQVLQTRIVIFKLKFVYDIKNSTCTVACLILIFWLSKGIFGVCSLPLGWSFHHPDRPRNLHCLFWEQHSKFFAAYNFSDGKWCFQMFSHKLCTGISCKKDCTDQFTCVRFVHDEITGTCVIDFRRWFGQYHGCTNVW